MRERYVGESASDVRVAIHRAIAKARRFYLEELGTPVVVPGAASRQESPALVLRAGEVFAPASSAAEREANRFGRLLVRSLRFAPIVASQAYAVSNEFFVGAFASRPSFESGALTDEEVDEIYASLQVAPSVSEVKIQSEAAQAAAAAAETFEALV